MAPIWSEAALAALFATVGSGSDLIVSARSFSPNKATPTLSGTSQAEWLESLRLPSPRHIEVLDISHSPHLSSNEIIKRLDHRIAKVHSEGQSHRRHVLADMDVSSCTLGDKGVLDVFSSVTRFCDAAGTPQGASKAAGDHTDSEGSSEKFLVTKFRFAARMNRLTTDGAAKLFDMLSTARRNTTVIISTAASSPSLETENVTSLETGNVTSMETVNVNSMETDNVNSLDTDNVTTVTDSTTSGEIHETSRRYFLEELDLGLNNIGNHLQEDHGLENSMRSLLHSIRSLVEATHPGHSASNFFGCPRVLRLDRCGIRPPVCRAIGKAILNAAKTASQGTNEDDVRSETFLECLHLGGNVDVGDAGTAALAAALRTSPATRRNKSTSPPFVLDVLDLSSCELGNAGAEALALAIADNPGCVRCLDLSNNHIADEGITQIAAALQTAQRKMQASGASASKTNSSQRDSRKQRTNSGSSFVGDSTTSPPMFAMDRLILSNNIGLGEAGVQAVAGAIKSGAVRSVILRSCAIGADGATALGKAIVSLALKRRSERFPCDVELDLSGNAFGIRRPKKKEKPYSASLLKSKASETTKSYVNFIGNRIKKGLRDVGLDIGSSSAGDGESDDEEEARMGSIMADLVGDSPSPSATGGRCGAQAFADAILDAKTKKKGRGRTSTPRVRSRVGMRRCFLDEAASDALAAAVLHASQHLDLDITFDVTLNGEALEEETVAALALGVESQIDQESRNWSYLEDKAQRHLDNLHMQRSAGEERNREKSFTGDGKTNIPGVDMTDFGAISH